MATLMLAACYPYYGPPDPPEDTAPSSGGTLDTTHEGWRDPSCWDCHIEDGHDIGLEPYQCIECHGTNGAPRGHTLLTPCAECHVQPHGAEGFPDPEACQTCHVR